MSNNPTKRAGLTGYGIEIIENVPIEIKSNVHNELYLKAKRDRMGHTIMKNEE
jgi:3,4-dihydroxy 2-butanone 4-phosphate synthase/GTP cyclohydrolase II